MYPDMSLEIVGSWVLVTAFVRAEGADVAWRLVSETVADHLVLAFEAFAALGAGTICHWTVVRARRGMRCGVGAVMVSSGLLVYLGVSG